MSTEAIYLVKIPPSIKLLEHTQAQGTYIRPPSRLPVVHQQHKPSATPLQLSYK